MFISTQETVLFTTKPVHKTELTTVMCAVVHLRALMARQAARLITNQEPLNTRTVVKHDFLKIDFPIKICHYITS
jgi:hypothetical protein